MRLLFFVLIAGASASWLVSSAAALDYETAPTAGEVTQATPPVATSTGYDRGPQTYAGNFNGYTGGGSGWYFEAGALFLHRTNGDTIKIIEEGGAGGGPPPPGQRLERVNSDDLDFDYAVGPKLTLGRSLCCCRCLEITYYGLNHWNAERTLTDSDIDVPFDASITSDFDGAQQISAFYNSELHNVEVNVLRHRDGAFTGLVGFRYLSLDEHFDIRATDNAATSDYLIDTDNDLVGGQIGAIFDRPINNRWSWNVVGKAGLFVNFAHQNTLLRDNGNTTVLRDFSNGEEDLAFVGDLAFNLEYQWNDRVALTMGYQLLWLEGMALAPEQLDFTTTAASGSGLDHNGSVFLDGVHVGLIIVR